MVDKIEGPFGLWGFPLLNRLMSSLQRMSAPDSLEEKLKREAESGGAGDEFEKTFRVIRDSDGEVEEVKVVKEKK